MPPILKDSDVVVNTRPGKKRQTLLKLLEEVDTSLPSEANANLKNFFRVAELADGSLVYTMESSAMQHERIARRLKFIAFVRDDHPKLVAAGLARPNTAPADDPLNFNNVDNLIGLLKTYMTVWCTSAQGRGSDAIIAASTVKTFSHSIIQMVGAHIKTVANQSNWPLDIATRSLSSVLRRDVTGQTGVLYQITNHAAWLIDEFKLPAHTVKQSEGYGREELEMVLDDMTTHYLSGLKDPEDILQRMIKPQLSFTIGLRIGSMVASPVEDESQLGMAVEDIEFEKIGHGLYILYVTIRHLKGYNTAMTRRQVTAMLMPLEKAENLHLEPTIPILVLLIRRGKLKEYGDNGKMITTLDQLLTSNAHRLVGVGKEPLFRVWRDGKPYPMNRLTAHDRMGAHCRRLGLKSGGFHNWRRDFAKYCSVAVGDDTTRTWMNHLQSEDALNHVYTEGLKNFNLAALRCGELNTKLMEERKSITTYYQQRVASIATQLVAKRLQAGLDGTVMESRPGAILTKHPSTLNQADMDDYIREADPTHAKLMDQLDDLTKALTAATGIKIKRNKAFLRKIAEIQKIISQHTPIVQKQLADAILVYEMESKGRLTIRRQRTVKLAKERMSATPVVSPEEMKQAHQILTTKQRTPVASSSSRRSNLSHPWTDEERVAIGPTFGGRALTAPKKANSSDPSVETRALIDAIDKLQTDGVLTLDDDNQPMHADDFDQGLVFKDSDQSNQHAWEKDLDPCVAIRLAWIKLFYKAWDGPATIKKLTDFMKQSAYCPLCPFGMTGASKKIGSMHCGVFGVKAPEHIEVGNYFSTGMNHMREHHPQELTALAIGEKLNLGAAQSPYNPVWAPSLVFQTEPDLALQHFSPLSQMKLSEDQQKLAAKWLSMPAFCQPINKHETDIAATVLKNLTYGISMSGIKPSNKVQQKMCIQDYTRAKGSSYKTDYIVKPKTVTINGITPSHLKGKGSIRASIVNLQLDPEVISSRSKYSYRFHPYK